MTLSKKYYQKIAQILKENQTKEQITTKLIEYFKTDNPNFDEVRFKEATQ